MSSSRPVRLERPRRVPQSPDRIASDQACIPAAMARTLGGLLDARAARTPEAIAYRWFDEVTQTWLSIAWQDVASETARRQAALAREGLRPGERIVMLLPNGLEWVLFDQAALGLGLVTVPLPPKSAPEHVCWALELVEARLLLLNGTQWAGLAAYRERLPVTVCIDPVDEIAVRYLPAWLPKRGGSLRTVGQPDDLASIVFTSGTTGPPKGVMLSHRNLLSNAAAGQDRQPVSGEDLFLSVLPLFHTLERTVGYYLPMMAGAPVAFGRGPSRLRDDLQALSPSIVLAVPRLLERLVEALRSGGLVRRVVLALTVAVGFARFTYRQGRQRWNPGLLLWPALRPLLPRGLKRTLGGRLRLVICGGAPLAPDTARTLIGLEMPILQGYGLTETSPVVSANSLADNDPASVGRPLEGTTVTLTPDGELLVRGPGVMRGYWRDPAATARTIDPDGWLHTGDLARLVDGRIYIVGRVKDIIVLSTGEKVHAAQLEQAITADPLFEQILVFGDNKPYLAALVVLAASAGQLLAREGLTPEPAKLKDPRLHAYCLTRIARRLARFPDYAQVRRVICLSEAWSVDSDLLTHTLKAKREKILARYADLIDDLYATPHEMDDGPRTTQPA